MGRARRPPHRCLPEHKHERGYPIASGGPGQERNARGAYPISSIFVSVETDEGVSGLAGTIDRQTAFVIDTDVAPLVIGEDPLAIERIWDKLYRQLIHARKGQPMFAISALDVALWDLKGKWLGPAGLPAAGRSGARQHPGLRQHAGLFAGARPRHRPRA